MLRSTNKLRYKCLFDVRRGLSTEYGKLVLEDGSEYSGKFFGSKRSIGGEVVFSTNMIGYPESMTDPSFYGQIRILSIMDIRG